MRLQFPIFCLPERLYDSRVVPERSCIIQDSPFNNVPEFQMYNYVECIFYKLHGKAELAVTASEKKMTNKNFNFANVTGLMNFLFVVFVIAK